MTTKSRGNQGPNENPLQKAASDIADQAGATAGAEASRTMTRAGDTLDQVARAVREAGQGMRDQQPTIATVAETAAEQVERASQYLREHEAQQLLDEAHRFARRQPAVVVGGGLLLGVAVGRFLKIGSQGPDAGDATRSAFAGGYAGAAYPSGAGYEPTELGAVTGHGRRYGDAGYAGAGYTPGEYATAGSATGGYAAGGYGTAEPEGLGRYETAAADDDLEPTAEEEALRGRGLDVAATSRTDVFERPDDLGTADEDRRGV